MSDWVLAAALGVAGVAAMFGLANAFGYSPRRLAWQDLSLVRRPDANERVVLKSLIRRSLTVYVPILIAAIVVAALMIMDGIVFGLTVLICFGTPPLLAVVRAVRVLRYLDETA